MEKEPGDAEKGTSDAASLLDAANLFGGGHSLFGGIPGGLGPHLSPHLPFTMLGGRTGPYHPATNTPAPTPPPTAPGPYGSLGTLSVAASQAASLGINPAASAAWWTMASHLAAQDYLARLQASAAAGGISFGGLPGAESLVPSYPLLSAPHSQAHVPSNKSSSSKNTSSKTTATVAPTLSTTSSSSHGSHQRDRDRERERERDRDRERERDHATTPVVSNAAVVHSSPSIVSDPASILGGVRLPPDTEIIKYTSSIVGPKIPGTTNRGRKKTISLDPPSLSVMPTPLGPGLMVDRGAGRSRRPVPNRIMQDAMDYRDSVVSNAPLERDRDRERERERERDHDRVEVIKLPAHSSNGTIPLNIPSYGSSSYSSPAQENDAPLNLSLKPQSSGSSATVNPNTSNSGSGISGVSVITTTTSVTVATTTPINNNIVTLSSANSSSTHQSSLSSLSSLSASLGTTPTHTERISRRKPGPKPRRVVQSPAPMVPTSPSPSLKQLFAAADSPRPSSGSEENDTPLKDGRPRNLGRGVSKPKKNTVASLLAQSRALGIKPTSSPEILPHNHQVSLLKSNVLAISPTVIKDTEGTEEDEMAPMSAEELEQVSTLTTQVSNSEDSKPENNKHKRHLVSSRSEDNKLKIRAVEGMSEDSSAPDVSSDSGSNSDGFPSDSEGEASEAGSKREGDGITGPAAKRRKMEVELHQLRVPLELGWRRETVLGTLSRAGLMRGEVSYISPCGRRFRQCQDVMRFIEKNNITELSRDNFSFSCRVLVGEFLQPVPGTDEMRQLSEDQVNKKLQELRQVHSHKSRTNTPANAQRIEAARMAQEQKLAQQLEREKAAQAAKEAKRLAKEEAARQKEHVRLLKEKERCERQETIRREREQRNLQMMEARRRRQEALEKQRHEEQVRKQQERELKRQQAVMIKEQERERRRQHMLLVKALEARKRQEERERKRQEVRAEKMASKERKLEQRRMELELVRELRKPAEDMELTDHKPLPTLNRIPGLKLSGQAFADTLMVFEFLHNFGETLGFDMDSLPSLNSLQMALLNDEEAEEELLSVMTHLLVCAIEDPGIPNPARHTTILGQSLKQADITHANLSEILRIYLYANATGEVKALTGLYFERDRDKKSDHHNVYGEPLPPCGKNAAFFEHLHDNETWRMSEWLHERPFLALNPTHKAAILAFLCNELLQNKAVIRQIDNSIETVGQLRKDRWLLDTKIRKLRMLHGRKIRQSVPHFSSKHDNNGCDESNDTGAGDVKVKEGDDADDDNDEEPEDAESGNESDGTQPEEEEDKNLSVEELNRKMERLSRQSENSLQALSTSAQQLRATCFGQDRFFRRYWSLPCAGGIFVEAMESAEPELYDKCLEKLEETQMQAQDTCNQKENTAEEKHFENDQISENEHRKMRSREKGDCVNDEINDKEEDTDNAEKKMKVENIPETVDTSKDCSEKLSNTGFKSDSTIVSRFILGDAIKSEPLANSRFSIKEEEDVKQEPIEDGIVSVKVDLKHDRFSSELNKLNENKFEEVKKDSIKFSAKMQIEEGEDKSEASFLVQGPIQFEHLGECMEKANRDTAPIIVPNGDKFNALNHLYSLNSSNVFNNGKDLNGSFLLGGSAGSLLSERTWFSILPRDSCDVTSITNSSNLTRCIESSTELRIPVFPPPSRLSSPSPGGSQCESPAPLVLTAEEMIQLEHLKKMLPLEPVQAKPVPKELQRGWWRITDKDQLQTILDNLHSRGVRERELKRVAGKYLEHALESCSKVCVAGGEKAVTDLAITDMDHKVAALPGGAPLRDEPNQWFPRVALRVDLQMLEQVEVLEDKVANASMQVKGWKVPGRITSDEGARFRPSCMPADLAEKTLNPVDLAKDRLISLEAAIERRYLKPPLGISSGDVNLSGISGEVAATEDNIPKGLVVWREAVGRAHTSAQIAMALYMLEASIAWDKSIMKAVSSVTSASGKGSSNCQFCHSGDNEDKLLLCDGCDKGYHTYCFKPKMENIPDGDWYCFECLNKATGERNCIVCGKKTGKNLVLCDLCPRAYHTDCLQPSLNKIPRGKWLCPTCQAKQPKKRNSSRRSGGHSKPRDSESSEHVPTSPPATPSAANEDATSLAPNSSPPQVTPITPVSQSKKERASGSLSSKKLNKDLNPCRAVLEELEAHDEAWPFLLPVNTKQFPTYRKIIKNPMDLSTIKRKLQDSVYKSREDFCSDVRLIFNNCETFNEDDSPVGKAGHSMRSFFETRWSELNGNHQKPSTPQ